MHIVVCLKQVPRTNSVKVQPDMSIRADGIEQITNLFDAYAVEEALLLHEQHGGTVTVLSLGPPAWMHQLRRALAMGATDAVLLHDPTFADLDALGAARVIAAAIKKLGTVDLVLAGRTSTDEESGVFAPALARMLGCPPITYVGKIVTLDPASKHLVAERLLETTVETVATRLPAVISVAKDMNQPRYPSAFKIKRAASAELPIWNAADLKLNASDLQPAVAVSARVAAPRQKGELIEGADAATQVRTLVDKLLENHVI